MNTSKLREEKRLNRHRRIRKKVSGTAQCPRLCIHRSLQNISVQAIDDSSGKVILGMSTLAKEIRSKVKYCGNAGAAALLGEAFASLALGKGVKKVSFDRGGYIYHGRVKAFAEAARKGGLEF